MLIIASGIGTIYEVVPPIAILDAGRDGWLSLLMGYGLAAMMGIILLDLGKRFPDQSFVQYLPTVLGKIPGKIAGLIYVLGWWVMTPIIIRADIELIRFFLPNTPLLVLIIMLALLIIYVMVKGFEVFARTTELFVIFVVFSLILILGLNAPSVSVTDFSPVLAKGFQPVLKGLVNQFAFAVQAIMFMALWFPYLNNKRDGLRAVGLGMAISGMLLTILVIMFIGFTGTSLTPQMLFPIFYMSRYILIGDFLKGLEAVFMLLWIVSSYLAILLFSYPSTIGLAQWLNMKDYRPLIIPMMTVSIVLAMIPANMLEVAKYDGLKNPLIILPMASLIPIAWLVARLRKV